MEALIKGTIETVVVEVTDLLDNLTDLADATELKFDIENRDGVQVIAPTTAQFDGMNFLCLVDTTGINFTVGKYHLFISFVADTDAPRLGPVKLEVV